MANTPQAQPPESNKPKKTGYLVCDGALCTCDAGAKPAKLKVKENKKVYINDDSSKLLATEKDFTFDPPSAPFVSCKNAPSQDKTCKPQFQQWLKTYDAITAEGKKVLVDQSELMCMQYGGKVTVLKHGQVQKVSKVQLDNVSQSMATELNALAPPAKRVEKESNVTVSSIKGEPVVNEQFKPLNGAPREEVSSYTKDQIKVDPNKKNHPAQLLLRPKEEAKLTATYNNDGELISWKIEGYEGASPFYYLQHGPTYTVSFPDKGTYKVEAYGTRGDGQLDWDSNSAGGEQTPDPTCMLEIVVRPNEIKKLKLIGDSTHILHGSGTSEDSVRANFPLTIEPVFLIPPTQADVEQLVLLVKDAAGIELKRSEGQASIVFTPPNTGFTYKAEAYFNGTEDESRYTMQFKTIPNVVKVIGGSIEEESKVRPGTEITFSVMEYTFKGQPKDIAAQEIKWRQVGVEKPIATGPSFKTTFHNEGNYIIEAYVKTANAIMPSIFMGKGDKDEWRFTVTRNYPTGIVAKGKAKVGLTVHYAIESIFPLKAEERSAITWSITGPITTHLAACEQIKIPFSKQGTYSIKASLNGQTKELVVDCIECKIVEGWWTDADGNHLTGEDTEGEPRNTIGFASWGQDACVAIRHVGLEGEKMTLEIWDNDTITDDPVATKEIIIPNTDRPGFPITLNEEMKKKAGTELIGADARLYFKLIPTNKELKVQNAGAAFPSASTFFLKVDSKPRVKAYFSDNNDRTRYNNASIETAVHVQVKTTGLQDEELGVEIWECILMGYNKKLLAGGNKKPDKYGMISIPIKLKDIPLKTASETKLLYIKVIRKKDSEVLYDSDGKYNLTLYKVLKNEAISKQDTMALVVVDVSKLEKKEQKVCECEARVRAFMRMLRVGEGTEGNKGYTTLFGGGQFSDMSTHPQKIVKASGYSSSAAGAYQIMGYTYKWLNGVKLDKGNKDSGVYEEHHDYIKKYSVSDFSAANQDKLCVIIFKHKQKGCLELIIKGEIQKALEDYASYEWASLPPGRYGQPSKTMEDALKLFDKYLKEELNENSDLQIEKDFLNQFGFSCKCDKGIKGLKSSEWTNPLDYSQRTYYNSSGIHKEQNGAFGPVRLNADGTAKNHQGLDLFAVPGTACKACLDGEIVSYSNEGLDGYGNVLVLKVNGDDLRNAKRSYTLEFPTVEKIHGSGFDVNASEYYLRYAHLQSAEKTSGEVKSGDIICYTGESGNASGVPNPHLHFEVAMKKSGNGTGLSNRHNPAFFVKLDSIKESEQTSEKNDRQQ